jgi:hemolysin activation/secretion protein
LIRDQLRIAFLRAEAGARELLFGGGDAWSITGALEVRQGLDILGTTQRGVLTPAGYAPSRIAGDPTALVVRAELDGVIGLGSILSLAGRAEAQWANNPLLNFEEWTLGNFTIGRGYDPGSNNGDRALALRGELRADIVSTGQKRIQLFGFYDRVWLRNLDPFTTEASRTLDSWGGGVRVWFAPRFYGEIFYARPDDPPLGGAGAARPNDRLMLSLTVQFSPRGE